MNRRHFFRDENGGVLVEATLIIPLLLLLFASIIQFGYAYAVKSDMTDTARETARRMAVGELLTPAAAESYAAGKLGFGLSYTITAVDPVPGTTDVSTTIQVAKSAVAVFDMLGIFSSGTMTAEVIMRKEQ